MRNSSDPFDSGGKFHKFSCYEVEFACFLHLTIFCPLETRHFTSFSMRLLI